MRVHLGTRELLRIHYMYVQYTNVDKSTGTLIYTRARFAALIYSHLCLMKSVNFSDLILLQNSGPILN